MACRVAFEGSGERFFDYLGAFTFKRNIRFVQVNLFNTLLLSSLV